jgi:hypothetical protein
VHQSRIKEAVGETHARLTAGGWPRLDSLDCCTLEKESFGDSDAYSVAS